MSLKIVFTTSNEYIIDAAASGSPDSHLCAIKQQVRRCRHNWISKVLLVTGAGDSTAYLLKTYFVHNVKNLGHSSSTGNREVS